MRHLLLFVAVVSLAASGCAQRAMVDCGTSARNSRGLLSRFEWESPGLFAKRAIPGDRCCDGGDVCCDRCDDNCSGDCCSDCCKLGADGDGPVVRKKLDLSRVRHARDKAARVCRDCNPNPHARDYPEMAPCPAGPPIGQVAYPYYTVRGPRDFFLDNPPSIGPY